MALAPFTKIVVDKKEERKFRRRALRREKEYIEALWGEIRGETLYICAFVKMEHKASRRSIWYEDTELDQHEDEAQEAGLSLLGTIHTHLNCEDTRFGDTDLKDSQESQELVMGICAIKEDNGRKISRIAYWPVVKPLLTEKRDWDASITNKKSKRVNQRSSYKRR